MFLPSHCFACIVCNECRGGKQACHAGFVTGPNEVTCLSSILPSVIPASAVGDSKILWSLWHNIIALTFHIQTANLISPRNACCQGIQMLRTLHQFVLRLPRGAVLAVCLLSLFFLNGHLACDGEGASSTTLSTLPGVSQAVSSSWSCHTCPITTSLWKAAHSAPTQNI